MIPKQICVIVVPILELSIRCAINMCLILLDNISSVNNPYFQATASKWTAVFISAIVLHYLVARVKCYGYVVLWNWTYCLYSYNLIWWCLKIWKFCRDGDGLGNDFFINFKKVLSILFLTFWLNCGLNQIMFRLLFLLA